MLLAYVICYLCLINVSLHNQEVSLLTVWALWYLAECWSLPVFGPLILFYSMRVQLFADLRCSPSCTHAGIQGTVSICPPDCFKYKGTLDVFYKIIRQVGQFCLVILSVYYAKCSWKWKLQLQEYTYSFISWLCCFVSFLFLKHEMLAWFLSMYNIAMVSQWKHVLYIMLSTDAIGVCLSFWFGSVTLTVPIDLLCSRLSFWFWGVVMFRKDFQGYGEAQMQD